LKLLLGIGILSMLCGCSYLLPFTGGGRKVLYLKFETCKRHNIGASPIVSKNEV